MLQCENSRLSSFPQRLLLSRQKRMHGRIKMVSSLEEIEFHEKDIAQQLAAEFAHEFACGGSGTAWTNPTRVSAEFIFFLYLFLLKKKDILKSISETCIEKTYR